MLCIKNEKKSIVSLYYNFFNNDLFTFLQLLLVSNENILFN